MWQTEGWFNHLPSVFERASRIRLDLCTTLEGKSICTIVPVYCSGKMSAQKLKHSHMLHLALQEDLVAPALLWKVSLFWTFWRLQASVTNQQYPTWLQTDQNQQQPALPARTPLWRRQWRARTTPTKARNGGTWICEQLSNFHKLISLFSARQTHRQ